MKREEERTARIIDSPVGSLYLAATDAGLTHLLFVDEMDSEPQSASGGGDAGRIVSETEQQLSAYFSGKRREFDIPLAPAGTEFQLATWQGLRTIARFSVTFHDRFAGINRLHPVLRAPGG